MAPNPIQDHMVKTYRALRGGIAALGLVLPWVLWLGGRLRAGLLLQPSMSAYYHTVMRDQLVGVLLAVAALLYVYRGYKALENWALNLAALFLAGVAFFPMDLGCGDACPALSVHGTCAVLFFGCIAYVCLFRASDTLPLVPDPAARRRFRRLYLALGVGMVLSPALAVAMAFLLQPGSRVRSYTFFVEAAGVYVFAAYWIAKSRELRCSAAERLAVEGRLSTAGGGEVVLCPTGPGQAA